MQYSRKLNLDFPRNKTEKPWLNPKPKDELACQIEDKEGHDGYRHQEVKLYYFHILIVSISWLNNFDSVINFIYFFESSCTTIYLCNKEKRYLSILHGEVVDSRRILISLALCIFMRFCVYMYNGKGSIYWIGKWRFELERSICRTTYL